MFSRLNFHTYLPDVIRDANDDVETHIVEPLEPPDVRKSRQLTLDNMKLHRELEKMKQGECTLTQYIWEKTQNYVLRRPPFSSKFRTMHFCVKIFSFSYFFRQMIGLPLWNNLPMTKATADWYDSTLWFTFFTGFSHRKAKWNKIVNFTNNWETLTNFHNNPWKIFEFSYFDFSHILTPSICQH